jgi:hypothetical protein
MKLVIYFGLMFFSLVVSFILGKFLLGKTKHVGKSILIAFLANVMILGLGCFWWFMTETDGISQGLGMLYYSIAMGVIGIIDLIALIVLKNNTTN